MKSRALNLAGLALLVSLCGWTGAGMRPAAGQALDAGKPPAQIFSGTCSACHRSPRGLVRSISPGGLPGFLRQHYTTGSEMAGVMAAYVLGSGGTERVAEPPPKREPKQEPRQRAKSDAPEVATRNPDQKELSRTARQKAAKKGKAEPADEAKDAPANEPAKPDDEKMDTAKQEPAATEQPKPEAAAAVECKVDEPAKQASASADDAKPDFALPTTAAAPPAALLTLPGFPPPVPEPEPVAAAPASPDCDPAASTSATAARVEEAPNEQQKEPPPSAAPAMAEAPKTEPLRSAATEAAPPTLDIMQEEVHAPRARRTGQQKKRVP